MVDEPKRDEKDKDAKFKKLCKFSPDEENADKEDEILFRKTRSYEELVESSDRCLRHVNERLDQIEEEINADADLKKDK